MGWAKTTARQDDIHSSLEIWGTLYWRLDGVFVHHIHVMHRKHRTAAISFPLYHLHLTWHLLCTFKAIKQSLKTHPPHNPTPHPCVKMAAISHRRYFQIHRVWNFYLSFPEVCCLGFNWLYDSISSGNSLAPKMRQAMTWSSLDPFIDVYICRTRGIWVQLINPNRFFS